MCLLVMAHRAHPQWPLAVAANRDEALDRPSAAMTVLQPTAPRILGGRDLLAGGTWLAANEHGVIAGITNRPGAADGPARRSRGALPLALAQHTSAAEAARSFAASFAPEAYRPGWLMVGDGRELFAIDMTGGPQPRVTRLPPGVHVLENRPPGTLSPKAARTGHLMLEGLTLRGPRFSDFLQALLRSHQVPAGAGVRDGAGHRPRAAERQTACVHAGAYGTRSGLIALLPAPGSPPQLLLADGPPCQRAFADVSALWHPPRAV